MAEYTVIGAEKGDDVSTMSKVSSTSIASSVGSAIELDRRTGDIELVKQVSQGNNIPRNRSPRRSPRLSVYATGSSGASSESYLEKELVAKTAERLSKTAFSFEKLDSKRKDELFGYWGDLILVLLAFFASWFLFGDVMTIGGAGWSLFILWFCSFSIGSFLKGYGVPALLGNLVVGIILKALPGGIVNGLPPEYAAAVRSTGLSLILMRSGLELNIPMVLKQGWIAIRLTILPGLCEALACGALVTALWGMPMSLGVSLGFILAAVSPAVVVSGMFDLQKRGFGVAKGIPSLVVAAASFDDVVAISGYSIAIGFVFNTGSSKAMSALEGPINIVAGIIVGILGGSVCGLTRLFNSQLKRLAIVTCMGLFVMYLSLELHFHGAGALAGLVTTITASYIWQNDALAKRLPIIDRLGLSLGANNEWHHETEHTLAQIWDILASPLLFAIIGASVDFAVLDMKIIPNALLVVFCGMCVRVPIAYLATGGENLTKLERFFVGLAWVPKATVQAALGSVPLDLVYQTMDRDDPEFDKYERWGQQILVTAVVAILITAPIGLICINQLGGRWLNDDINNPVSIEAKVRQGSSKGLDGDVNGHLDGEESDFSGIPEQSSFTSVKSTNTTQEQEAQRRKTAGARRKGSFIGAAADYFDKLIGRSSTDAKTREAAMHKRVENFGGLKREDSWVYAEQRKRMTVGDVKSLNKRLAAHFFHNLTNHVEFLENHIDDLKFDENSDIQPEDISFCCHKIMEQCLACYKIIIEQEDKFPVQKLYSLVAIDENESMLNRKGQAPVYDALNRTLVVNVDENGEDPLCESLATLERRNSSVTDVLQAYLSRDNLLEEILEQEEQEP